MFNQSGFNQMPFNVLSDVTVYLSFEMDHSNEMIATANAILSPSFETDLSNEMSFNGVRDAIAAFVMDLSSEMEFSAVRDRTASFDMVCELSMSFNAGRYHVDELTFTGQFAPGEKIIIDSDKLKFTKNGQNALHMMQGDFFDINVGENDITYTDNQTGRTVRIRLTHRDRFV